MSSTKQRRGLSRPPKQSADAERFIESARTVGNGQRQGEESEKRRRQREPVHTFNVRMPVSEFDHLQSWAQQVSPRDSVHALVLKAIREKLERLDDGTDTK